MQALFKVKDYLSSIQIAYKTEGKNVTRGWVEIQCPFCGDHSKHLGISPSLLYHCWRCGKKGSLAHLITVLEDCSWPEAHSRIASFKDAAVLSQLEEENLITPYSLTLPKEATLNFEQQHFDYLELRGFNQPEEIIRKYRVRVCGAQGFFKFRFIIPVYMNGQLVNFVARDYTGKATIPYRNCSNEQAPIPIKQCLYNFDNITRDTVIIMEGVIDVWKMGDNSVATLGTKYTDDQILLLTNKPLKQIIVMFDADANDQALKLADNLSIFFEKVRIITLTLGDPGNLSLEEAQELRKDIFQE